MKQFKTIGFALIFLFGLTAMGNNDEEEEEGEISCTTIYTLCDFGNPGDHDGFVECMQRNGC